MIDFGKWAFDNKKLVYFLIAALIIGGVYSYYGMSKLEDPEIKVKQADSWDFNKGGVFYDYSEGMYVYGEDNGPNLVIAESGTYLIIFNDITGFIRFIKQ